MAKKPLGQAKDEMDMTPMIDIIFLLIIFFILAGKITSDLKSELITVPPTTTAEPIDIPDDWGHLVIDVFGSTQNDSRGAPPANTIKVGKKQWRNKGIDNYDGYIALRNLLDIKYAEALKYQDPKNAQLRLPQVVVEIRADGDAEFRLVQEIQQILSDTIDPTTMKPYSPPKEVSRMMPFVNILFTTRQPGDDTQGS